MENANLAWSCLVAFLVSMKQDLLLGACPLTFEKPPALGEYHILLGGSPLEVAAVAFSADSYITELMQRCGQFRCLLNQMETSYIYTFQLHLIGAKYSRCLCWGVRVAILSKYCLFVFVTATSWFVLLLLLCSFYKCFC